MILQTIAKSQYPYIIFAGALVSLLLNLTAETNTGVLA